MEIKDVVVAKGKRDAVTGKQLSGEVNSFICRRCKSFFNPETVVFLQKGMFKVCPVCGKKGHIVSLKEFNWEIFRLEMENDLMYTEDMILNEGMDLCPEENWESPRYDAHFEETDDPYARIEPELSPEEFDEMLDELPWVEEREFSDPEKLEDDEFGLSDVNLIDDDDDLPF